MIYIELPEGKERILPFYLALEEWVARNVDEEECFFMWQVDPTVIFGRNQLIENEVNLQYCREHGIQTYRRKSGGGCVYADRSNVMMSYVCKSDQVNFTFGKYTTMIVYMLHRMGVEARSTGRNDIMIGDRKVSGTAFYHIPGRSIVHGTMLYDTDMRNMVGSITPSNEKLLSKGIDSVRQRITLLKDHTQMSLEEFKAHARSVLCKDNTYRLTPEQVGEVETMMQEYLSDEFIYGNNPKYTLIRKARIKGAGDFELRLEIKNNRIRSINMMGDFFLTGDLNSLLQPLRGCLFTREALLEAVPENVQEIVKGLTKEQLVGIFLF